MSHLLAYEQALYEQGLTQIVGVDEVGRGPMAGPLVVAAVMLPQNTITPGLNDSKKLTKKKREQLYSWIKENALEIQVVFIDVEEVDRLNVYQASKHAMEQAIGKFKTKIDYVLSDAMPLEINFPYLSIIKGDSKSASIACASIVAKVLRDQYMEELDVLYPDYGFKKHKGYVTKKHKEAIFSYGVLDVHRKSFAPVQEAIIAYNKVKE